MSHTDEELSRAADRLEQRLDELDPSAIEVDDTSDLRAIAEAVDAANAAAALVRERVEIARARGRSWNLIALPLGVSRQAARERFADRVAAG
jgi:hypothetical protein